MIEKIACKFILVASERHFEKPKYKMIVHRAVTSLLATAA